MHVGSKGRATKVYCCETVLNALRAGEEKPSGESADAPATAAGAGQDSQQEGAKRSVSPQDARASNSRSSGSQDSLRGA